MAASLWWVVMERAGSLVLYGILLADEGCEMMSMIIEKERD